MTACGCMSKMAADYTKQKNAWLCARQHKEKTRLKEAGFFVA
jgi:hypothetical protein